MQDTVAAAALVMHMCLLQSLGTVVIDFVGVTALISPAFHSTMSLHGLANLTQESFRVLCSAGYYFQ